MPPWASLVEAGTYSAVVDASPPLPSGRPGIRYRLRIWLGTRVMAQEAVPGTSIPAFCPDRHLNGDETFCLGLERFDQSEAGFEDFWAKLRSYLLCQQYADRHGVWPTGRGLSHGDAAHAQIEAESHAEAANLARSYRRALEFGTGRLAGDLIGLGTRLANDEKPGRAALRRLIFAELERRRQDALFLDWVLSRGLPCCGTMKHCPVKSAKDREG